MSTNLEKIPVRIYQDSHDASKAVANRIARIIRDKTAQGKPPVLGLATGHTPINVYRELIRMHKEEGLDFSEVITFNLDEYWPIDPQAVQSYHSWMHENFFDGVNVKPENIHIPSADVSEDKVEQYCEDYEKEIRNAGGIDLQLLGIGRSGHIGFNEPGSSDTSRTRVINLDRITRKDAASDFFGEENVPHKAITMGVGTILEAREICLLAFGEHKASIIKRSVEGNVTSQVPATFLQEHSNATFYCALASAESLTRVATPWLVGSCEWDEYLERRAVIWLSNKLQKPILKLTEEDYAENGLIELLRKHGGFYHLNISMFRRLMDTITGWPGGKQKKKKILVFSPHPDDDVICMGGTIARLAEQGHEVHIAYQVSGYISVFDHDVLHYAEFVWRFHRIFEPEHAPEDSLFTSVQEFFAKKKPGEMDTREIRAIKGLIRRGEAVDAAKFLGVPTPNCHFLDLPFYDTGKVQKSNIGDEDIRRCRDLIGKIEPDMIFAAGDMSDPHGTHRLCLQAAMTALDQYKKDTGADPQLLLYRGAWQEWEPQQIDMAVPLSPDELKHKRYSIFRHQSQKDRAMFPGPYDSREFWQRAEDRNRMTAETYDLLGLPEYHAIEAFVRYPLPESVQTQAVIENE